MNPKPNPVRGGRGKSLQSMTSDNTPSKESQMPEPAKPNASSMQPSQVPTQRSFKHAPRPVNPSNPGFGSEQGVHQLTKGVKQLSTNTDPIRLGRGVGRNRRAVEYYRAPRPESSTVDDVGKQGRMGQTVKLIANYFPITSYTNWTLYQYRVDFSLEEDRLNIKKGLLHAHQKILGPYIFDGSMLFSCNQYESGLELISKRNTDDQIIHISLSLTNVIKNGDYASIQIFNLILKNCLRHLDLQQVGRNYYDPKAKFLMPRDKIELWPGYETTIGMFDSGLLLRAEITTKVMRQETVLDFFRECYKEKQRNSQWMDTFKQGVIGSVVITMYNNQTYRIDDVDDTADTRSTFTKRDGTKITYSDYYQQKWGLTIDSVQPMLVSKKKALITGDDEESLIYLIPQFCNFTGITDKMRSNFSLMKEMSNFTRLEPKERIKRLNNFIQRLVSTPKSIESLERWNLKLKKELVEIPGRILPAETIFSNNSKYDTGSETEWSRSLRSSPMYTSVLIKRWVIVIPQMYAGSISAFASTLTKVAAGMNFNLPQPEIVQSKDVSPHTYVSVLEQVVCQINPSLILCVVPSNRADTYNLIKRKLCVDRAIPSQVVTLKNVQKCNMSVITKIAIQINCKLGGAPWMIKIPVKGMMIMGFDVCHDSQRTNLSYGAFVASMNDTHTNYFSSAQKHEKGEELSHYFVACMAMALNKYREKNNVLPSSIVVYRDGVGDGQISYVHKTEVALIKRACKEFYGENEYGLAFIIVKKRGSTRFVVNSNQGPTNPPPGTVIDNTVTDPTMYDFFLVSQNVRFGTVCPTHYCVIVDTLKNWSPDKMQRLTYKLTHMYYNWSGTVAVPAPCQMAHKLAFFAAQTLRSTPCSALDELLYFL